MSGNSENIPIDIKQAEQKASDPLVNFATQFINKPQERQDLTFTAQRINNRKIIEEFIPTDLYIREEQIRVLDNIGRNDYVIGPVFHIRRIVMKSCLEAFCYVMNEG